MMGNFSFFYLTLSLLFFCWGSFINSFANFLITKKFKLRGIYCNLIANKFNWYNLFIELLAAIVFTYTLYILPFNLFITAFIFFTSLLITIRTDIEHMLISEAVTLSIIPIGLLLSYFNQTWTSWQMSLTGTIVGYFSLWCINKLFYLVTKKEGIGAGDMDLLAMIGSFTGIIGIWFSILFGSISASMYGIILICKNKNSHNIYIPFGPFISIGAILFILLFNKLNLFLFQI